MRRFQAAAAQFRVGSDKTANLETADRLVRQAVRRGASLVALPEQFSWGGRPEEEIRAAESIPGPTSEALAALAAELGIHLVGGSILEKSDESEKVFNTSLLFDPSGKLIARYRKIHLFDVDFGDHLTIRESSFRMPGTEPVVVKCEPAAIGLAVCYDLRFPELFRALVDRGAGVICIPSAFTFATGAAHWETLLRARAIENQVYVIAPNQCGRGPNGMVSYGSSMIIDPWGTILARSAEGEGLVIADIDLDYLDKVRREMPCLDHRALRG